MSMHLSLTIPATFARLLERRSNPAYSVQPSNITDPPSTPTSTMSQLLSPFGEACSGAAGALFANAAVYPLDVVATRLQVQSKSLSALDPRQKLYKNQIDALIRIAREEGLTGLYSGMAAGLTQTVASNFAYFYVYSVIRRLYMKHANPNPSTIAELILGAVAGGISRTFTTPISVITTRGPASTLARPHALPHTYHKPAITYGLFERLKPLISLKPLSTFETFCLGALTKALATIVTYPYIMAKVRLQWKPPAPEELALTNEKHDDLHAMVRYKNTLDVLRKVLRSEGFVGWYTGMPAQLLKAVIVKVCCLCQRTNFKDLRYCCLL
ncbi:mitochondrial carrier domain-containing protein [Chytridium lagenaria]|nr:mitochondrial carrier domain-containing protein [Chytridium lagenaria]